MTEKLCSQPNWGARGGNNALHGMFRGHKPNKSPVLLAADETYSRFGLIAQVLPPPLTEPVAVLLGFGSMQP